MSIASNMLKGAATGAAAGSVVPGWGTAIGAVVGAGVGLWQGVTEKKATESAEDLKVKELERRDKQRVELERLRRVNMGQNADLTGSNIAMEMFAYGNNGIAPIKQDITDLNKAPISSSADVIVGSRHEQGGVEMDGALVEGGEVVDAGRVFSDRLIHSDGETFAVKARKLNETKAKKEQSMIDTNDRYKVYSSEREIEILNSQLSELFDFQGVLTNSNQF